MNPIAPPQGVAAPKPAPRSGTPPTKLGPAYWAGLAFGGVCILLGLVLGMMGARIAPSDRAVRTPPPAASPMVRTASAPSRAAPPATPTTMAAAPAAAPTPPAPAAPAAAVGTPADPAVAEPLIDPQVAVLQARLTALEAREQGTAKVAAAALALASLAQAAEGSQPFAALVDAAGAAVPASADLAALRQHAAVGAPSRADLAASYPGFAARAAVAARQPTARSGLLDRLGYYLAGMITIRRTDRLTGPGADAILARAGRAAAAGDLSQAVGELATLSAPARGAIGPWRADAERRLAMEAKLAALRASAGASLRNPTP